MSMQLATNELNLLFPSEIHSDHDYLKAKCFLPNVASSTLKYKTSLLFYNNYFKYSVFNNRENNCNTNTSKCILGQFL